MSALDELLDYLDDRYSVNYGKLLENSVAELACLRSERQDALGYLKTLSWMQNGSDAELVALIKKLEG